MILVTGATGLVGGHLIWHLLQENEKVVAIKRNKSNLSSLKCIFRYYTEKPECFLEKIEWRTADISDKDSLNRAMENITEVYHCAAIVSLASNPENIEEINVQGTKNVVDIALAMNIRKLCFVSSIAACGSNTDCIPVNEDSVWEDNADKSPYSRSKFYSEQVVWEAIKNGLNAVIVNPGVILGYSGTSSGSSLLFEIVRKGLPFYIDGGSGYVSVEDVVKAMILLMKSKVGSERYILVENNYSNKEILGCIAVGFNKKAPVIKIGGGIIKVAGAIIEFIWNLFGYTPPFDRRMAQSATKREFFSSEKIKNEFGFEFVPLKNSIEKTCKFIMQTDGNLN